MLHSPVELGAAMMGAALSHTRSLVIFSAAVPDSPPPATALAPRCPDRSLGGSLVLLAALLLVLGDQVVHVGLGLSELHLVHALARVPVQEGLAAEHRGELLGDALHHLLHAGGVAAEADRHLEALGRDVAHGALHVVRDPLDEVRR